MSEPVTEKAPLTFALVGNPNCGKTTLFNALTGLKQKVGNYPGVTVERKEGECYSQHGKKLRLIDLPGTYSLSARSPDEAVMRDVLLGRRPDTPRPDRVIVVIDASNLERNLYLLTQILELGLPVIVALNMTDVAEEKGLVIDVPLLSERLGVPVVPIQATEKKGIIELKAAMSRENLITPKGHEAAIPADLRAVLEHTRDTLAKAGAAVASRSLLEPLYLLSDHDPSRQTLDSATFRALAAERKRVDEALPGWEDTLVATRYDAIGNLLGGVVRSTADGTATLTDRVDAILLHRVWGWVSLIGMLGGIFFLIFSFANIPMAWVESLFGVLSGWVENAMPEGDLRSLIVDGALAGVQGVVIFLPQIVILFFFIGIMEDTGYMARIAFIMDRFMGKVGLNGRSFLPLLSSYACAVPGVMAARTIDSPKDRLITILVVPLASCSARLPVYLLLIGTMVPGEVVPTMTKVLVLLSMYALGTLGAFFFAWLFNRTMMKGTTSVMILELPSYRHPSWGSIGLHLWERTRLFIRRAGTVILGLSIILWALMTYPKSDTDDPSQAIAASYGGKFGHAIEPVIKPLGYDWKIGIGLAGSFAAREVFVSTMSIIYAIEQDDDEEVTRHVLAEKLRQEKHADGRPIYSIATCLSLMVFYVFAMQCLSTVAVVRRETNGWKWPLFQLGYMTGAAYVAALVVYQTCRLLGYAD
jgi:ferrous iron transport protein B